MSCMAWSSLPMKFFLLDFLSHSLGIPHYNFSTKRSKTQYSFSLAKKQIRILFHILHTSVATTTPGIASAMVRIEAKFHNNRSSWHFIGWCETVELKVSACTILSQKKASANTFCLPWRKTKNQPHICSICCKCRRKMIVFFCICPVTTSPLHRLPLSLFPR